MKIWLDHGVGLALTTDKTIDGLDELNYIVKAKGHKNVFEVLDEGDDVSYFEGNNVFRRFDDIDSNPEKALVVWSRKDESPFQAAYAGGFEELKNEFIEALGRYLPADFDWDAHIGHFTHMTFT